MEVYIGTLSVPEIDKEDEFPNMLVFVFAPPPLCRFFFCFVFSSSASGFMLSLVCVIVANVRKVL